MASLALIKETREKGAEKEGRVEKEERAVKEGRAEEGERQVRGIQTGSERVKHKHELFITFSWDCCKGAEGTPSCMDLVDRISQTILDNDITKYAFCADLWSVFVLFFK